MVDALGGAGAGGTALADEPEALVTVEAKGAAQLGACLAVDRTVERVVWGAAVCRWWGGGV